MANIVTCIRIVCSAVLLFCDPFSRRFYVLYIVAGISDMLDGFIARQANTASEFGSKLDTAADFVFAVVCLIKLIPVLNLKLWMYGWIAVIAAIKIFNIASSYFIHRKMLAVHSVMNKITGALLFLLPLTLNMVDIGYSAVVVCSAATIAAIQECFFIRF